jgi:hypothetical protein
MLKKYLTLSDFVAEFAAKGHGTTFTTNGFKALYDYFNGLGEEFVLNVDNIVCDYVEESWLEYINSQINEGFESDLYCIVNEKEVKKQCRKQLVNYWKSQGEVCLHYLARFGVEGVDQWTHNDLMEAVNNYKILDKLIKDGHIEYDFKQIKKRVTNHVQKFKSFITATEYTVIYIE